MIPADLRLRLLATLALVLALSQIAHLALALAALPVALLLAALTRPGAELWRRLLHVEGFVLILLLALPLTIPGTAIAHLGPVPVSREGLLRAALLCARITAAALILIAFLGREEPIRLGAALHALRAPEPLVRILVLAMRYLGLIREEATRLSEAMRLRGFRPGMNRHTWKSYGNLTGMLLLRALDRAARVDEAMRLRGFSGHFPHSALAPPVRRDKMAFAGLLALALLIPVLDRL